MSQFRTELNQCIRWAFSLGKKFLGAAPIQTSSVQVIYIFSQVLLLLAFFLPLKAIIIVSSGSIPNYFPSAIKSYSHNTVVIWLSVSAIFFYAIHLCFELLATKVTAHGARSLIAKTKKIVLFDNQESIAINAYSRFTRGLADLLFFIISAIVLFIFYPLISTLIGACIVASYSILSIAYNQSKRLRKTITLHSQDALNTVSGFIFLIVFLGVIGDFLYFTPPPAFTALISLLLVRQSLQRLIGFCIKLIMLRAQHLQITAMFFHNLPLLSTPSQKTDNIHTLIAPEQRQHWMPAVLKSLFTQDFTVESVNNFQLGYPDVYCYGVDCASNTKRKSFIIKLFDSTRAYAASQEASLISEINNLPCPKLLKSGLLKDSAYHIFEWNHEDKMSGREYYLNSLEFQAQLLALTPPAALLKKFGRSKSHLENRLHANMLKELSLYAVTAQDQAQVLALSEEMKSIKLYLSDLPKQLISFDITPDTLLKNLDGQLSSLQWGNWHFEPVGANWPVTEHQKLEDAVRNSNIQNASRQINLETAKLCSVMYLFERYINKRDYQAALNLIKEILSHARALKVDCDLRSPIDQ
ncbi:hypothetical protein [Pseudomonas oryzicola]|uniref:ABC transmembrane type-1 domain-containing protein n=1 Tax=Pseudomonas oryzicola TaxID=485876 RepID=A0ABS6QGM9_9PSED|nr:hypothetical protein [Pseudomonas oryzicola]MBV4493358.1 hypothetical protein [Pseudomonas oryzicola]